ncbi:hypothetical protein [Cerasicoccus frondis]|uniref:hypothetical protein n=1 Tax=Cerasicoccus frondis TaxID=490090 RepID=UPI002852CD55|nr:hypothetical protein [Cerasicoccus frondis]
MGLTVTGICADLFSSIGIEDTEDVPSNLVQEAINALNLAVQTIWSTPLTYFIRESETIVAEADTSEYQLPQTVRKVIGPVLNLATNKPLMLLTNEVQALNYEQLFLDEPETPINNNATQAYYVKREKGESYDNAVAIILLKPTPQAGDQFRIDVVNEPESYGPGDYDGETKIEMPHDFTESLLLPIARREFSRSKYHNDPFKSGQYDQDYARAMISLGLQDPQLNPDTSEGIGR